MQRALRFSIAVATAAVIAVSCQQPVTMFTKCEVPASGDPTGTDGTYLLICEDGIWQPVMTLDEFVLTWQGKSPAIGPLPTSTTSTSTTTSSTTSTSTTTTTVPPAATLAVAYSNVDGNPGFDAGAGDRLIAKLVDTNSDDVVSAGDTVTFGEYPVDADMSSFLSFTNKVHVVESVDTASATVVRVEIEAGSTVAWEADASEKISEQSGIERDVFIQDRTDTSGGDIEITGDGPVGGTPLSANTAPNASDEDYLNVDITL